MQHDRAITISITPNRMVTLFNKRALFWSEFVESLKTPVVSPETLVEYMAMTKDEQVQLKDVGGFVGGVFQGNVRLAINVLSRDIITLDLDSIPAGETFALLSKIAGLGYAYVLYSTRKHMESKPRLRVCFLMSRVGTLEEYEPLARKIAEKIGINYCDASTFQAERLMFYPSRSSDGDYVYNVGDFLPLDVDKVLGEYTNWRDCGEWAQLDRVRSRNYGGERLRQAEPKTKKGIVGAFCRTYSVVDAIDEFLLGIYEPSGTSGRYTYTIGTTVNGVEVYDDGDFLLSHHGSDPARGTLRNAFDLVRIHKFGQLDAEAPADTPDHNLPSCKAMRDFAMVDPKTANLYSLERVTQAGVEFDTEDERIEFGNFLAGIKRNSEGKPFKTVANYRYAFEADPRVKDCFYLDQFSQRWHLPKRPPWDGAGLEYEPRDWAKVDDSGVVGLLEATHGLPGHKNQEHALVLAFHHKGIHPVKNYFAGLMWDGIPRLDTLFIDYLGCADTNYTKRVTRLWFVGAVARIMRPGIQFDNMPVLSGKQGIGKSALIRKMARGWGMEGFKTFDGKEASEKLQGRWLIEIGELHAFKNSSIEQIKDFLTLCVDYFRVPYDKHPRAFPRSCVFIGTTNAHDYLTDRTGNRRFYPLDIDIIPLKKDIFTQLDGEVDQLWAEALHYYNNGEKLYIPNSELEEFISQQEEHMECDSREGLIEEYLTKPIPEDWYALSETDRMNFSQGSTIGATLVPRDRVCALELWRYCFGQRNIMPQKDTREINAIVERIQGWKKHKTKIRFGDLGIQIGFNRVSTS